MNPPKIPRELEPEDEGEDEDTLIRVKSIKQETQIVIGDLAVTTNHSTLKCKRLIKDLLSDKQITKYLGYHKQKKFLASIPLGVG